MKTPKSILYFVLGTFVLFMTSCEPKKLKEEDVLLSNAQVEDIIKDGQLYNINEFLAKFMDPGKGNFQPITVNVPTIPNIRISGSSLSTPCRPTVPVSISVDASRQMTMPVTSINRSSFSKRKIGKQA